jgi:hypothetical protein
LTALRGCGDHLWRVGAERLGIDLCGERPDLPGADPGCATRHDVVADLGRGERGEHRRVLLVEVGVGRQPVAQGMPARGIGRDLPHAVDDREQLARDLTRELTEEVFLAGEVLVEGRPRAPGRVGDVLDAGRVVADLAEHVERGAQDALLGAGASDADRRFSPNGALLHPDGLDDGCRWCCRVPTSCASSTPGPRAMVPSDRAATVPTTGRRDVTVRNAG